MTKVGFLFPGQGSQFVGMGEDFFQENPGVRDIYKTAEKILGFDLAEISFRGPEEKLKQTQFTQPALYVHSFIVAHLLQERGVIATEAAGHSLGEISAFAYGKAFSFEEGLELVRERARLMRESSEKNPGSMAAIVGLGINDVMELCIEARDRGIVQPANYNAPQQIVISGSKEGVAAVMNAAKQKGARRVMELPVSGAFHSPLMAGAVENFGIMLQKINITMPVIPVYANATAHPASSPKEIRTLLHHQLTHSVRWVETIENMVKNGVTRFIEVGAGKVLSGLVKRIDQNVDIMQCGTVEALGTFSLK